MKRNLLLLLRLLSLLVFIGFTLFIVSVPISASFLSIKPPSINNVKIELVNDTLIANASYSIVDN
ncbi:MAG TPA: hypothetical protein VKU94_04465, partial [Geobacterales bacterium]|nr:hypothetical protein [Geobacterales bacterium]